MNTLFFGNNASTAIGCLVFSVLLLAFSSSYACAQTAAPAEPMSDAFVYKIQSSGCKGGNWDIITPRHSNETTCHHGGSQVKVAVVDDGLGYLQYATLDGGKPGYV